MKDYCIEWESNQNLFTVTDVIHFFGISDLYTVFVDYMTYIQFQISTTHNIGYNMFIFTDGPVFKRKIIYPEGGGFFQRDILPGKTETLICPNVYVIPSDTSISYNWTQ